MELTATLQEDVVALATSAGRMVGTPGHEQAKVYLVQRMTDVGLEPYRAGTLELPYGKGFTNLVGRIPGSNLSLSPLLLGAHYDTAGPYPGADDNAAAVAILLSLVESLRARALERSVVVAFFDAEEPPFFHTSKMGSTSFFYEQQTEPVHAALILDLVGHDVPLPGLEDLLFITGMESDPNLARVLRANDSPSGLRLVAAKNAYVGDLSDHHVFRLNERPYLFMTCGRHLHYHMPTDTPEKLNYAKMAHLAAYLLDLAERVCSVSLEGPWEGYDSTPYELAFMRAALGPLAAQFGITLESRQDIDRIAATFMGQFQL